MYHRRRISIWNLVIGITFAYIIMPIVSRFISSYLTTYFYLLIVVLILLGIVFENKLESMNEYIGGVLLPFIFFQSLSFLIRTDSIVQWGYSVLLSLLPVIIGYYVTRHQIYNLRFFTRIIIFVMVITAFTTCIGLIRFPYAARILATISSSQDEIAITYNWLNIGGYEYVYMLVLLYPILIMAYKRQKINLIIATAGTVVVFITVILSEYTIAFLLVIISTLLYFAKRNLGKRNVFLLLFIGILFVMFFSDYVSQFLSYVGTLTGSEIMTERLNALAGGQAGLEASESNRIFLYEMSINTFLRNPIFGTFLTGGGDIGGHSFILDTLGMYGLMGAALLYFMYRKIYRCFVRPFDNEQGYGYVLWAFFQSILLSCTNTGMWLEVIAMMVPILVCAIYGYGEMRDESSLDY